jgi:hypothetical protein
VEVCPVCKTHCVSHDYTPPRVVVDLPTNTEKGAPLMAPTTTKDVESRIVEMPDGQSIIVADGDDAPLEYGYRELEPNQGPGDALPHEGLPNFPNRKQGATPEEEAEAKRVADEAEGTGDTGEPKESRTPAAKPADLTVAQLDERYGSVENYPSKGNKAEKVKFAEKQGG